MEYIETGSGFSIELEDWKLKRKGIHNGLPLYECIDGKVTAIALVQNPAIGVNAIANDERKTIFGPIMIPYLKIYRNQGLNGPENCYWFFSSKTIEKLQSTYQGKFKFGH